MSVACGVYGYSITRSIELDNVRILPRTTDYKTAKNLARDLDSYQLTAVLIGHCINEKDLFDIEAVLSFMEQLDVIVSKPIELADRNPFAVFPEKITAHKRNCGGGVVVGDDAFFPTSRSEFSIKALGLLQDKEFCEKTGFRTLLFKCIETFRQRKPFVEISYFLLFSGLESFARSFLDERDTKNAPKVIFKLLNFYGFNVREDNPKDLKRSVSSYVYVRNALFHNGEVTSKKDINQREVEFDVIEYLPPLSRLVPLVIMKAVGFDDGSVNWESWIDMLPFQ